MGYERDDRFRGSYGDRPRGYGRDEDRSRRDSGGGDYGRSRQSYDRDERGFFERAGDEVRSWFGDEEAERRRHIDERDEERRYGRDDNRDRFERGDFAGDPGYTRNQQPRSDYQGRGGAYGLGVPPESGYGWSHRDRDRDEQRNRGHDPHYRNWRDRQMESFDRDYEEFRRENQSRFESEFGTWRQNRERQRQSLQQVKEHQEVVGSDGQHVGIVDHVRGERILLTKTDANAGGHHHSIPVSWIRSVGEKVEISKTAEQAQAAWRDEDRGREGEGNAGSGARNLNRSFSGTD